MEEKTKDFYELLKNIDNKNEYNEVETVENYFYNSCIVEY